MILEAASFDLSSTLISGQCFRWNRVEAGKWRGIVRGTVLSAHQIDGLLHTAFESPGGMAEAGSEGLRYYFDLEQDYESTIRQLKGDPRMDSLIERCGGLHILRQDPFEVLISFIISAFNNILRIKRCVQGVARGWGDSIGDSGSGEFGFPTPTALSRASEEALRACGLGYRARYVLESSACVAGLGDAFDSLVDLPTGELRQELLRFPGVGPKVVECVLLFGYHRLEAFPIDVWVRRAMCELFYRGRETSDDRIARRAQREFGATAGIAQQYLFTGFRTGRGERTHRRPREVV
ncbi:MAG: DNA-3-methyladenine glycosylase 2 [Acidobacteria bacterium]|nr:DNA-3-methyladenine glycosylase 2 [Acidobacteriota bacterium]